MVLSHRKISDTVGSFTAWFDDEDHFGTDVVSAGDLDNDGVKIYIPLLSLSHTHVYTRRN